MKDFFQTKLRRAESIVYRPLTDEEHRILRENLCVADDWSLIEVAEGFNAHRCHQVTFSGKIRIGSMNKSYATKDGVMLHSGLDHCFLHNCIIGDDVVISRVHRYITNYVIDDNAQILNVDMMSVRGKTSFGNGVRVSVLNETGGREVVLSNIITSQTAYVMAFYRHDEALVNALFEMSNRYAESVSSETGYVGCGAIIKDCGTIINLYIGAMAHIHGAARMENGTLNSNEAAPVCVGHNVIAKNFICASGSSILDGCTLSNCYVGQGTHLSHLFSAHDSLFFANCQAENGEACAVFAGPYTVTMHKSSLLIAGYYSFLNAGSGSNQSNHLYKLGPIHQGVVERGSKTTSDSYILWPSRIGAFSLVMGRHVHHVDSSDFPFSYLIEDNNQTYLVPGVNLRSVGTIRDARKWPKRDVRKDSLKSDNINFNLLSPYTVGKMVTGHNLLVDLVKLLDSDTEQEYVYHNMRIRGGSARKGINFYKMGINKFLGNSIIKRLEDCPCRTDEEVIACLRPAVGAVGQGDWLDICGMLAPRSQVDQLIDDVKEGRVTSLEMVNERVAQQHSHYYDWEWAWAYDLLLKWHHLKPEELTRAKVTELILLWKDSVIKLDKMLYEDARKEFTMNSQVGFGIDVAGDERTADFELVRGSFDSNPFVKDVLTHIEVKSRLGDEMLARLA